MTMSTMDAVSAFGPCIVFVLLRQEMDSGVGAFGGGGYFGLGRIFV